MSVKSENCVRNLKEELQKEKEFLEKEINELKDCLKEYPAGTLQINYCRGHVQFYYRSEQSETDKAGRSKARYIKKKDLELARQLAQRDYETKLLRQLEDRYCVIDKALSTYLSTDLNAVADLCSKERRKLIVPRYISDEEYAAQWQAVAYVGKSFAEGVPEIFSVRGERVRSKSEKIIADTFDRNSIPYRYECPLEFKGEYTIYPDFTILNKRTRKVYYLEHLGMMDDSDYAADAVRRIEFLGLHGVIPGKNLLITSETKSRPLNMKILNRLIQEFLI